MLGRELIFALIGTGATCLATVLGAATVFFFRKDMSQKTQQIFLGFAAGVMTAAAVFSLLLPAMEQLEAAGKNVIWPVAGGFAIGALFLFVFDRILPHLHIGSETPEGLPSHWRKTTMLVFAVTLHNIPEGVAVALPVYNATGSKKRAFWTAALSGMAEPLGAVVAYFILAPFLSPVIIGGALALTAGLMVYISLDELLPMAREHAEAHYAIIGVFAGMALMAVISIVI